MGETPVDEYDWNQEEKIGRRVKEHGAEFDLDLKIPK
jgi:hypothetical protein